MYSEKRKNEENRLRLSSSAHVYMTSHAHAAGIIYRHTSFIRLAVAGPVK